MARFNELLRGRVAVPSYLTIVLVCGKCQFGNHVIVSGLIVRIILVFVSDIAPDNRVLGSLQDARDHAAIVAAAMTVVKNKPIGPELVFGWLKAAKLSDENINHIRNGLEACLTKPRSGVLEAEGGTKPRAVDHKVCLEVRSRLSDAIDLVGVRIRCQLKRVHKLISFGDETIDLCVERVGQRTRAAADREGETPAEPLRLRNLVA